MSKQEYEGKEGGDLSDVFDENADDVFIIGQNERKKRLKQMKKV